MDVFISFAHEDESEARVISGKLDKKGISNFLASKKLRTGESFEESIRNKLQGCKALFLLLTPNSLKSEWVTTESGAAWALEKHIFPILLRCRPDELPARLSKLQCKDYHNLDEIIEEYNGIVGTNPPPNFPRRSTAGTILFDIDGTLLKSDETFRSDRGRKVVEILKGLIKEGFRLVLITGNDYNVQHKRVLLPFIEQGIAKSVFCFSDGGSRAFEFDEGNNDFKEDKIYSDKNLISEDQAERISSVFYSLLPRFLSENDALQIPVVELSERTLNYIDLSVFPIRPSFRSNSELFDDFCQEIRKVCENRAEMRSATFELFADPSNSSITIRAHGQEPEADVYKLQGMIYRKILRQNRYKEVSKPELEKRGGDVICQIALKPFNDDRLRTQFREQFEDKLKMEGFDDFAILTGGKTTIDIQLKGVNKARAVNYLLGKGWYDSQRMIYFGDEFNEFGNDYPVATMSRHERPKFIVNVGRVDSIPRRIRNDIILDGNGPDGTKNFLELLLFESKL